MLLTLGVALSLTAAVAMPIEAAPGMLAVQGRGAAMLLAAKATIDAKQAAAAVKKRYQGKILSVQLIDSKGPPVYRVKTITPGGIVKVVFVDGNTGDVFE